MPNAASLGMLAAWHRQRVLNTYVFILRFSQLYTRTPHHYSSRAVCLCQIVAFVIQNLSFQACSAMTEAAVDYGGAVNISDHIDWAVQRVACSPELCPECSANPTAHSVYRRGSLGSSPILYTCPSEAVKYNQHSAIVTHFTNAADALHAEGHWVWVFDATNLEIKHVRARNGQLLIPRLSCTFRETNKLLQRNACTKTYAKKNLRESEKTVK